MINEIVPGDAADDFYGGTEAAYLSTTIPLFQKAGIQVNSIQDILDRGVYITNAVKIFPVSFLLIILKAFFATSPISMITFTLGNSDSSRSRYGRLFAMLSFAIVDSVFGIFTGEYIATTARRRRRIL